MFVSAINRGRAAAGLPPISGRRPLGTALRFYFGPHDRNCVCKRCRMPFPVLVIVIALCMTVAFLVGVATGCTPEPFHPCF